MENWRRNTTGQWSTFVFDTGSSAEIHGASANYTWGWAQRVTPDMNTVFIAEVRPDGGFYDFKTREPSPVSPLAFRRFSGTSFTDIGFVPNSPMGLKLRPVIRGEAGYGHRGNGSQSFFAELVLRDVDFDGLIDIQFKDQNGALYWVGFDSKSGQFKLKL